jgi:hypothetical protein
VKDCDEALRKESAFQTILTASVEFLEDLAKLRFSKIVKGMFAITRRDHEVREAELKAPGKEIAFIADARSVFRKG